MANSWQEPSDFDPATQNGYDPVSNQFYDAATNQYYDPQTYQDVHGQKFRYSSRSSSAEFGDHPVILELKKAQASAAASNIDNPQNPPSTEAARESLRVQTAGKGSKRVFGEYSDDDDDLRELCDLPPKYKKARRETTPPKTAGAVSNQPATAASEAPALPSSSLMPPVDFSAYINDALYSDQSEHNDIAPDTLEGHETHQQPLGDYIYPLPNDMQPTIPTNSESSQVEQVPEHATLPTDSTPQPSSLNTAGGEVGSTEAFKEALDAEKSKQANYLILMHQQQDPLWEVVSEQEKTARIKRTWMDCARRYEGRIAAKHRIDMRHLPFDTFSQEGLIIRLQRLVELAIVARNPPQEESTEERLGRIQDLEGLVRDQILRIVRSWTNIWKEVSDGGSVFESAHRAEGHLSETVGVANGENVRDSPLQIQVPSAHDLPDDDDLDQTNTQHSNSPATSAPPQSPAQTSARRRATRTAPEFLTKKAQSAARTTKRKAKGSTLKTTSSGRGAPRVIMFPGKPSRDRVLTEDELADLDNILEEFPEHLSVPSVMERFLRPQGATKGGYPTNKIVQGIRKHKNAWHGDNLDHPDRDSFLKSWVLAQRDTANMKRAGGYGKKRRGAGQGDDSQHDGNGQTNIHSQLQTNTAVANHAYTSASYPQPQPEYLQQAQARGTSNMTAGYTVAQDNSQQYWPQQMTAAGTPYAPLMQEPHFELESVTLNHINGNDFDLVGQFDDRTLQERLTQQYEPVSPQANGQY
jgi:hypothetical protein